MSSTETVWSDATTEVHRLVVGPIENNVYVVRCRETGRSVLIDAANEPERLVGLVDELGVELVLTTHGHWDHVGAVPEMRAAGVPVGVRVEDAALLAGHDRLIDDGEVFTVGRVRLRAIHTPGHTPGSVCFALEDRPVLFTGDTLFPGGPGNTSFEGGDFATIIASIEDRLFRPFAAATTFWPGHGAPSTLGAESSHLEEWVARGW